MNIPKYKTISASNSILGEGISLSPSNEIVYWVDILGHKIFELNLVNNLTFEITNLSFPSCTFSYKSSGIFVAHDSGISWISKKSRYIEKCVTWFSPDLGLRCNDGVIDTEGNIWISTMSLKEEQGQGSIWFWDRLNRPKLVIDNLTIPNSILIDERRQRLYFADSRERTIYSAELSQNRKIVNMKTEFLKSNDGIPDGSTLDKNGNIWNTRWDAGKIVVIDPLGQEISEFKVPFKRPTSCKFTLDENHLFVTSARTEGDFHGGETIVLDLTPFK